MTEQNRFLDNLKINSEPSARRPNTQARGFCPRLAHRERGRTDLANKNEELTLSSRGIEGFIARYK